MGVTTPYGNNHSLFINVPTLIRCIKYPLRRIKMKKNINKTRTIRCLHSSFLQSSTILPCVILFIAACFVSAQQLPLNWRAAARDNCSTTFEAVESMTNAQTAVVTEHTNRYVEVGSGLNYLDEQGQWTPSQDVVELATDGGAQSVRCPTKVHFNSNLTSDGTFWVTHEYVHSSSDNYWGTWWVPIVVQ